MTPYPRKWTMMLAGQAIMQPMVQVIVWLTDWPSLVKLITIFVAAAIVSAAVVRIRWWFWDRANPPEKRTYEWLKTQRQSAPWN